MIDQLTTSAGADVAQLAFQAWARGEQTGLYDDYKALLSDSFRLFSHPLLGRFIESEALACMLALIAEREKTPNQLVFSNIGMASGENTFLFQFDSVGTVSGGFSYQGYNIIGFVVEDGRVTGFREYFGHIDPQWFK
ncbi:hypothetical protein [Spirosoma arcticum]